MDTYGKMADILREVVRNELYRNRIYSEEVRLFDATDFNFISWTSQHYHGIISSVGTVTINKRNRTYRRGEL